MDVLQTRAHLKVDQPHTDIWDLVAVQKGRQASTQQVTSKAEVAMCQGLEGTLLRGIELGNNSRICAVALHKGMSCLRRKPGFPA